jgi:hypothetical protein
MADVVRHSVLSLRAAATGRADAGHYALAPAPPGLDRRPIAQQSGEGSVMVGTPHSVVLELPDVRKSAIRGASE